MQPPTRKQKVRAALTEATRTGNTEDIARLQKELLEIEAAEKNAPKAEEKTKAPRAADVVIMTTDPSTDPTDDLFDQLPKGD